MALGAFPCRRPSHLRYAWWMTQSPFYKGGIVVMFLRTFISPIKDFSFPS